MLLELIDKQNLTIIATITVKYITDEIVIS